MNVLSNKEIEQLGIQEREEYYKELKDSLKNEMRPKKRKSFIFCVTNMVLPHVRKYGLSIKGAENIPTNQNCLFVINHSNAHDLPTLQEVMNRLNIHKCFLASSEDLSPIILKLFKECGAVLFNRFDRIQANSAFIKFTSNLVNGENGVIFPESTWNLHPYKPMHLIKSGAVYAAAISEVPIIPVIFEYVETEKLCKKESEIITECIVTFGEPVYVSRQRGVIEQTDMLQNEMETLRRGVWKKYNIKKDNFNEDDIKRYLNHTYLKKFAGAAAYDSERERKALLVKNQESSENDYHINEDGAFVPGVLDQKEGKKYLN